MLSLVGWEIVAGLLRKMALGLCATRLLWPGHYKTDYDQTNDFTALAGSGRLLITQSRGN
jgi:hypothetical protein